MLKFIHKVALLASLIALAVGLWQDWEVWLTLKRMLISYLGFYLFGSFLSIAVRMVSLLDGSSKCPKNRVPTDGMETAFEGRSHNIRKVGQ